MPVSLAERGGPWWTLKRAWRLSEPDRTSVWLLLGGLTLSAWIVELPFSSGPLLAIRSGFAALVVIADAALAAVLYGRLVDLAPMRADPSSADPQIRSTLVAAAGTYKQHGHSGRAHKRRR